MKIKFNYKPWLTALCLAGATLVAAAISPPAYAGVANNGLFELDGNATNATATPGDDWDTLYNGGGSALKFTGILTDPAPRSIFDGGKKDIQNVNQWSWKDGAVPNKDDITDGYAAAYNKDGDLLIYFGADRLSNNGDAFMGFWFFKQKIAADPVTGTFKNALGQPAIHTKDDVLVLVNYPQASNAVPYVAVIKWDPTCTKATSNNPVPGDCAAQNLRLVSQSGGTDASAKCDSTADQLACAITNDGDTDAPWAYSSVVSGSTNGVFPYETFFEGGINLTQLLGGSDSCYSSFMAETRSSSSFTASLKDFVLGDFELCSVKIVKECKNAALNSDNTAITYTFNGSVTNNGFGALYDIKVMDDNGTPLIDGDDFPITLAGYDPQTPTPLAKDETLAFASPLTFDSTTQNPPTNGVKVTAASTPGGAATIIDSTTALCPKLELSPVISVTKDCTPKILVEGGKLVVKVGVSGTVCNKSRDTVDTSGSPVPGVPGPINLTDVKVWNDINNTGDPTKYVLVFQKDLLKPGECVNYAAYDPTTLYSGYYPTAASSEVPANISFSDTVHAQGVAPLGFGIPTDSATATCRLCPTCPSC